MHNGSVDRLDCHGPAIAQGRGPSTIGSALLPHTEFETRILTDDLNGERTVRTLAGFGGIKCLPALLERVSTVSGIAHTAHI